MGNVTFKILSAGTGGEINSTQPMLLVEAGTAQGPLDLNT